MKKRTTILSKMSRVFAALLLLPAFGFLAASCSDDEEKKDPNIIENLSGTVSIAAGEASNTATLSFEALSDWSLSYVNEDSEWFIFTPENGAPGKATITFTAPYNESAAKVGKLTLKHGTSTYTIVVNQAAGKPDMPTWDKEALESVSFAPDAYNATSEMPINYTLTLTSVQDYSTLEEAPFEIMTFYADNLGIPTDSVITWAKFAIADNSPAANNGKKIELTLDTIALNNSKYMLTAAATDRYAFICLVPRGTDKAQMFDKDGNMKDEYKAMGTSIEQKNYSFTHTGPLSTQIMDFGMPITNNILNYEVTTNSKFKVSTDPVDDEKYITSVISSGNKVTSTVDIAKLKADYIMPKTMIVVFYIDRGPDLKPVLVSTQPGLTIMYVTM